MTDRTDLTLFDLDHTLLDGDSNQLWLAWLVERGLAEPIQLERQHAYYAAYQAGTLDIDAYVAFHLSLLVERDLAAWTPLRDSFVAERIAPRIGAAARETVARHVGSGDAVAVVTATHDFLARGIVDLFGPLELVATRCAVAGGRFTGRMDGSACFSAAKPGRVAEWLAARGASWSSFAVTRFYSDSMNDLPLLEAVAEPIVVDPDPKLAEIALARGWPVQRWSVSR